MNHEAPLHIRVTEGCAEEIHHLQSIKFTDNPTVRGKIARGELYSKQLGLAYKISCYSSNSLFTLSYFFLNTLKAFSVNHRISLPAPTTQGGFPFEASSTYPNTNPHRSWVTSLHQVTYQSISPMLQQYTVDRHIVVWGMLRKLTSLDETGGLLQDAMAL